MFDLIQQSLEIVIEPKVLFDVQILSIICNKFMKTKLKIVSLAVVLSALNFQSAFAEKPQNDWVVRLRGVYVKTDVHSKVDTLGGGIATSTDQVPELDITRFFTPNIAAELIAATTTHDIKLRGSAVGNAELGSVKLLPPTLTLQYHLNPTGTFRPYVGAGLNYTFFYDVKTGGIADNIKYKDHIGYAAQVGFDYMIDDKFGINFDIKKIFLQTTATVNNSIRAKVDLDPWLIGAGVSYRF